MPVLRNIGRLVTCREPGGQGAVHAIAGGAIAWREGRITWVGKQKDLPARHDDGQRWDAQGQLVVPGLVDAHTHLCFAGWRADDFVARVRGESYQQIARRGGGIHSTVHKTRAADTDALYARCRLFLRQMLALGVTTVEAKSGYGLDAQTEARVLAVYAALATRGPQRLVPTYLGAHVVPHEYRNRRGSYVALVEQAIALFADEGLARFVDVFVEDGAFTVAEARRLAGAARMAGLGVKLHVDQLSAGAGAELAAEMGAVSADHLEHVSKRGIARLAKAGTVAVSLPIATLYLGTPPLPARALIKGGVPVAVATDFNPGTAPSFHLPLALTLAATLQKMTPAEVLKGATLYGARAVGLDGEVGSLEAGKAADFVVLDAPDEDHFVYHFRPSANLLTVIGGVARWRAAGFQEKVGVQAEASA
jgi:imidazolonepropionase